MARYERFDDDTPAPKFIVVTTSNNENLDLFASSNQDETTTRHALITLNIVSVVVSSVCGVITFFLAIEERSTSALGYAIDTILDVLAFLTIIWRFISSREQERKEIYVLRILAVLFFISGFGVFIDSIQDIRHQIHPISNQYLAIAVLIQTLVFFCLATGKYFVAKRLQAISAYSDAFNTFISAFMALSVAISIAIYNSYPNVWFLDPMIGMFISMTIMCYGIWMLFKSFRKI